MKIKTIVLLMLPVFLVFQACEKEGNENEHETETKISKHNDDESHNAGENCMSCHVSGGEGEGLFVVAGTVYKESKTAVYPNTTVQFHTEANAGGTLVKSIEVDGKGNFYSTETLDFGTGLYTSVIGDSETKYMMSPVSIGACNSCHSTSSNRIWAK